MSNFGNDIDPNEVSSHSANEIVLTGSWENKDRSITAAAITGIIGIGALYFNVQSIFAAILMFLYSFIYKVHIHGEYFEQLSKTMELFKVPLLTAVTITQYLFMMLPALWIVKRWHTRDIAKYIRLKSCSVIEIILAVLITIALLPTCYFISYLLLEAINYPETFRNIGNELFTSHSTSGFLMLVFVICITPAICEEIFFRGYVQRTFERTMGAKSFLLTGFLFGLFHMQPLGLFSLSILGILFSLFYYRSKSLLPSGAAHFTNNLIAISLLNMQTKHKDLNQLSDGNLSLTIIFFSLVAAGFLIWLYLRITKYKPEEKLISLPGK